MYTMMPVQTFKRQEGDHLPGIAELRGPGVIVPNDRLRTLTLTMTALIALRAGMLVLHSSS